MQNMSKHVCQVYDSCLPGLMIWDAQTKQGPVPVDATAPWMPRPEKLCIRRGAAFSLRRGVVLEVFTLPDGPTDSLLVVTRSY